MMQFNKKLFWQVFISIILFIYLMTAYSNLQINPLSWNESSRQLTITLITFSALITVLISVRPK